MFSVYDGYRSTGCTGETYFAGANTADGFIGSYEDIANERKLDRVYIIKGGAGCGKSTIMKKAAKAAENRGYPVGRYLCGSDPESLDCVVLDGRVAILDGTPPHTKEMIFPGAKSEIIDVTRFWDNRILEEHKDEIVTHASLKSAAYASAYRYIRAAESVEKERRAICDEIFEREKATKYCLRVLKQHKIKPSAEYSCRTRYSHALTMRGLWKTDSDITDTHETVFVSDQCCSAEFMETMHTILDKKNITHVCSLVPINRTISAISIVDSGLTLAVGNKTAGKTVNVARFVNPEREKKLRGYLRLAGKCERECLDEAVLMLSKAAEHHFALEEIYKSAMDFDSLAGYIAGVIDSIIFRLEK